MQKYFKILLEFDHKLLKNSIEEAIRNKQKGYVCVVDANVLTVAQKNEHFLSILNHSLVNTCDGSSIATLAGIIHKKHLSALNGPQIFNYFIEKNYSQLLLGSNEETSNKIKEKLRSKGFDDTNLHILPLPFNDVEGFDYAGIAAITNELKPQIIWVSLGAPKQEIFMSKLLPYIDSSVMIGIGAAFDFYIGKIALPKFRIGPLKFIWISRVLSEPSKQISRIIPYIKILPSLYLQEKKWVRLNNQN
ncbi:WecB/TagA/CpsF family glycosyltransferase [Mucilaginibacter panaciglaebae]|uniref:N-acetylglucosaminyldiphosphoundecaprenol N-acetyl-beta-D-mannosaminyltransferase n=1 Tax=Mucilaginibacter panaciglaebae TaxID=502331 RepID=A0ABP7WNI2_9SPHI